MTSAPCPACGATAATPWAKAHDVEYCTSDDEYAFLRCDGCGVLFIDPIPADRLREIYPANYYSYAPQGQSLVYRVKAWFDRRFFRKLLGQLSAPSLRVLDVGGGAGWELSALRASDARVTATCIVDLDPDAAQTARQNGHDYFCGRIESFETEQKFDLVMLLNLIEHVQDPGAVLRKVAALLAPGGRVVIKTPNYDAWDARLFRRRNWAGYHTPRHWVLFTRESFTALAQRSGFVVREASYTQGAPFWAASVLAWLAARGLLRVTRERPVVFHPLFGVTAALFAAFDLARRPFARTSQMFFTLGL